MDREKIIPLSLFGTSNVQRKLEYLDRLRLLPLTNDAKERIKLICDSIEKDLGLNDVAPDPDESINKGGI